MTAIATSVTDSVVANVALGVFVGSDVTYSAPASAAMPPDTANATSLARVADDVIASAERSLSRTAMIERPMPDRRSCASTARHTTRKPRHR